MLGIYHTNPNPTPNPTPNPNPNSNQVKVDRLYSNSTRLQQEFVRLKPKHEHEREATLLSLVSRTFKERVIVFFASKKNCHRAKARYP